MTLSRSAPMRRTPLARGDSKLGARSKPRRVVHPFPLPEPGQVITLADVEHELHAFGPQAELCRRTECAACFAVRLWRAGHPRGKALPWEDLQTADVRVSDPHHEPHRGTKGESLDRDTMPLCRRHHTDGVGCLRVRHRVRSPGAVLKRRRPGGCLPGRLVTRCGRILDQHRRLQAAGGLLYCRRQLGHQVAGKLPGKVARPRQSTDQHLQAAAYRQK